MTPAATQHIQHTSHSPPAPRTRPHRQPRPPASPLFFYPLFITHSPWASEEKPSRSRASSKRAYDISPSIIVIVAAVFNCLFCNHERSVIIKLDKKSSVGSLHCNVCGQQYQTSINYLSGAVDVYADWVDAADEVKKEQRRAKKFGGGSSSAAADAAAADMMERRREAEFIEQDEDEIEDDDDLED
ncbi:hypothetical protein H072_2585 [Dactylellina haptotyla CBS 200.50]|uniref:Transcription elongation factor 1 homolog n=1 Tax=Dactylellina haptotyla (strain CBS 200.50) TaxID=1284197 RepID=S8AKF2_DACHA|nr:hypothetical protein H072_2585 [Dactylellina haptotyla CBS 200.50]